MHWDVTEVIAENDFSLQVRFRDGTSGKIRFTMQHLVGVFEPLKKIDFFLKAYLDQGAVAWPGNIDIAPDAMYHEIKKNGEWVLK